jgi:hypothetical protein
VFAPRLPKRRNTLKTRGEVGSQGLNRVERNDPEGVNPRRGAEIRRKPRGAGSIRRQRAAGVDPDHNGVDRGGRGSSKAERAVGGEGGTPTR